MTIQEFETTLTGAIQAGHINRFTAAAWRNSFRTNQRGCEANLARITGTEPSAKPVDWEGVKAALARVGASVPEAEAYPAYLFPELVRARSARAGSVEGTGARATPPRAATHVPSTKPANRALMRTRPGGRPRITLASD